MNRNILTVNNKNLSYCKGCAKHTAEVIEETEKHVTTLCGVCGRIRQRRKEEERE